MGCLFLTESGGILEGLFERGAYLKIHALKGGLFERAYLKGGLNRIITVYIWKWSQAPWLGVN